MISLEDWRRAPAELLRPLYDAECARWHASLGWDYRPSCGLIEAARAGGRLPGLLARDGRGRVAGWTYFLLHQGTLQIGNLVAREEATVRALLEAVLGGPDAGRARRLSCFLFPTAPSVEHALAEARFSILRHAYLQRGVAGAPGRVPDRACLHGCEYRVRPWASDAVPGVLALLAAAYEGTPEARCFAPDGEVGQWATYVHQLLRTPACGRFDGRLSLQIHAAEGELAGTILMTALEERVAHIAQMAVASDHRGRGLGEWLVRAACERAREAGYQRATLLVADSNARARHLYDRLGFQPAAEFLFADRKRAQGSGLTAQELSGSRP